MDKAVPKKTVTYLNKDFELLQEKFEHLKIDQDLQKLKSSTVKMKKGSSILKKIVALEHLTGLDYVKDRERKSSTKWNAVSLLKKSLI